MVVLSFSNWYNFGEYAKNISEFHNLQPKYNIIQILKQSFDMLSSEKDYLPEQGDLGSPQRQWLRVHISMQILALTRELTEDLIAICFACREAIKNQNKRVPEYLRDFNKKRGKGEPTS